MITRESTRLVDVHVASVPRRDDFSKALGSSHTIKSFKGCDFTRISEHLDRQKAIRRSASDAEKKATKEMKDKQLLKSGFALLDGHVEKVGNFRMEPPSLFRGRGKHPRTGLCGIKFRPPHAIGAMLSLELRLLDGVEVLRHRRDVIPVTATARWRGGSRRSTQYFSV